MNINYFNALNILVNTTSKHYYSQGLNKKLKLMGGALIFFQRRYWAIKYLAQLYGPLGYKMYLEIFFATLRPFPFFSLCYILNVPSLGELHRQTLRSSFTVVSVRRSSCFVETSSSVRQPPKSISLRSSQIDVFEIQWTYNNACWYFR